MFCSRLHYEFMSNQTHQDLISNSLTLRQEDTTNATNYYMEREAACEKYISNDAELPSPIGSRLADYTLQK